MINRQDPFIKSIFFLKSSLYYLQVITVVTIVKVVKAVTVITIVITVVTVVTIVSQGVEHNWRWLRGL